MARSTLGRLTQLVRANVNALIDGAEDPEKMLNQLVRDFSASIAEAEAAVAQTVGNLRLLEDDRDEARETAAEWGRKAAAASTRAEQLRAESPPEAERFDELARIALRKQITYEQQLETYEQQIAQQTDTTTRLKDGLAKLRDKRDDLVRRRDELVSRAKTAQAQVQVQEAVRSVSVLDPTSELSRFEERIRQQEGKARGLEEVAASSLEAQFAELDDLSGDVEVEERLKRLKGGEAGG